MILEEDPPAKADVDTRSIENVDLVRVVTSKLINIILSLEVWNLAMCMCWLEYLNLDHMYFMQNAVSWGSQRVHLNLETLVA